MGGDFIQFLSHKRKVDEKVVSTVLTELKTDPLASGRDLQTHVNGRLGRYNLSVANINVALEAISAKEIRTAMQKQLARGEAHYREAYLLKEMVRSLENDAGKKAGITANEADGTIISDSTALRKLVSPQAAVSEIDKPLKWIAFLMALYYHGVPLSVLGQWCSVHKTTVLRWILGMSLGLWPQVSVFLVSHIKGTIVYIGEKWIKIKRQWHYWFVVLDHTTGLSIVAELLKSQTGVDFLSADVSVCPASRQRQSSIESILPRARGMPFYQLVNDPLKVIVGLADVKQKVRMADFEAAECLTSQP